jgi:RND family efflux transporter MFP subunit
MNASSTFLSPQGDKRETADRIRAGGPLDSATNRSVTDPQMTHHRLGRLFFFAAILFAAALVFGLLPRLRERRVAIADSHELAQPTVAVVHPAPAKAGPPLVLSGELKPVTEASIHARVNGYVRRWLVDLGAKVEAGQLLAELDTPDTDRELSQARAQLVQAEAARDLAATTAKRWKEMLVAKTVSAQETDEKAGDLELKKATVEAARANVQRLEQVAGFARITAPFAGTITLRRIDVGELITAGDSQELYRLAQTHKLRVFVRVPQNYARTTTIGQTAEIFFPELPGKTFEARIVRTAGALDAASRTLLTELEVDNSKGEILAGSYAQVRLAEAKPEPALTIPPGAVIFRGEGPQVTVVDHDRIVLRRVTVGRDFGSAMEIRDGVTADDRIVTNPSDTLTEGTQVRAVESK